MKERVQNILGSLALGASLAMLSISMHSAQEYQPKTCDISGEGSEGLQNDDFCQKLLSNGFTGMRVIRDDRFQMLSTHAYNGELIVHCPADMNIYDMKRDVFARLK